MTLHKKFPLETHRVAIMKVYSSCVEDYDFRSVVKDITDWVEVDTPTLKKLKEFVKNQYTWEKPQDRDECFYTLVELEPQIPIVEITMEKFFKKMEEVELKKAEEEKKKLEKSASRRLKQEEKELKQLKELQEKYGV